MSVERTIGRANWAAAPRVETESRATLLGESVAFRVIPGRGTGLLPLVGIHGLGSEHGDLLEVVRAVGAPALLLDLPGFGASGRPERDYPLERAAQVALELLDLVGLERPVWLGTSYGAHVALRAALLAPERTSGLVLVDAGGIDPAPNQALAALFDERVLRARPIPLVAAALDGLVARPNDATRAFRARRLAAHLAPGAAAEYRAIGRSALGALQDDAGRSLEQVETAVELVHGALDALVPLAVAEAAAARLPRAALTILPGCGHMPWLESPAEVAACVRRACRRAAF